MTAVLAVPLLLAPAPVTGTYPVPCPSPCPLGECRPSWSDPYGCGGCCGCRGGCQEEGMAALAVADWFGWIRELDARVPR